MKISRELKYICGLFLATRVVLTIIGVVSRLLLEPYHGKEYVWVYSKHLWLDIWGVWDSGWYLNIATNGYPKNVDLHVESNYGFFPLYPLLMRIAGFINHDNFVAAILISNAALLVACYFLYKLVRLDSDQEMAQRSVKYLFLFPTAFIFSGAFTESLYLMLVLMAFYYARQNKWLLVGTLGFFLSLTRPEGVVIIVPLLYEYLQNRKFDFRKIGLDIVFLLLIPLGICLFFLYCYYLTGDWLAYVHNKINAWYQGIWHNPFQSFLHVFGLTMSVEYKFPAAFTLLAISLFLIFIRRIRFSYWLFGILAIGIPLSSMGDDIFRHMLRYLLPAFPLYVILADIGSNRYRDELISISLALLQGFLMVFWSNGFTLII